MKFIKHFIDIKILIIIQNLLKTTILIFAVFVFTNAAFAQSNYEKAIEYFGVEEDEVVVTDQYTSKKSGVEHIYLKQAFNGIEVTSSLSSIHFTKENLVLVAHNKFISNFKSKIKSSEVLLSAKEAIDIAADELGLEKPINLEIIEKEKGNNKETLFSDGGISEKDIPVKLVYQTLKDESIVLAWGLRITEIENMDSWYLYIDASTGKVIDKFDMSLNFNRQNPGKTDNHIADRPAENRAGENENNNSSTISGYRVFELPLENPIDNGASRTLVQNPSSNFASPNGWLDFDNITKSTYGNNVNAFDKVTGNRPSGGTSALFDFNLDLNGDPLDYKDAAITNAFYLGNMAHDILYHHGFDEVSGNFQIDNFGKGGVGGDAMQVRVQALTGACGSAFSTQPEGTSPSVILFEFDGRDGSFSNTIFLHEYGHGLSTRLIGGPSEVYLAKRNAVPLEGWSDIIALILTMKPSDNSTTPQNYGNWFYDAPIGIRPFSSGCNNSPNNVPYTTDLGINPFTFGNLDASSNGEITQNHETGFVWATMLWEMVWGLIDVYGFDEDLYYGEGGNNIALNLIIEGLKFTPYDCGFTDGRDAILLADEVLYNGANACIIWEAFAKRGLGVIANQGGQFYNDFPVENFDIPDDCICCLEFSDWTNNNCPSPHQLQNENLASELNPNEAYEFNLKNSISLLPGFKADSYTNQAFLAHIQYCIPQISPLKLKGNSIENTFEASIYPNPFSSQTTIEFEVESETTVSIFVTDVLGKSIANIANNAKKQPGKHQFIFDGTKLPVGIYYCTIQAGNQTETQKLVITK